jgi:hypothetical protein
VLEQAGRSAKTAPDGGVTISQPACRVPRTRSRAGDVRIVATNGGIDLALIGDSISSGCRPPR